MQPPLDHQNPILTNLIGKVDHQLGVLFAARLLLGAHHLGNDVQHRQDDAQVDGIGQRNRHLANRNARRG